MEDNINTYRVQLQQVEAALVGDPGNEELCKLKTDLLDIIELTESLMGLSSSKPKYEEETEEEARPVESAKTFSLYDDVDETPSKPYEEPEGRKTESSSVPYTSTMIPNQAAKPLAPAKVAIIDEKERQYREQLQELKMLTVEWKPGDKCQALREDLNQYQEAEVQAKGEGYLQIKFTAEGDIQNVLLTNIRKIKKRRWGEPTPAPVVKARREELDKDKKKKKKIRKKNVAAELTTAKEEEKKNWLSFMKGNKTITKTAAKKSIFASPDNFEGKIGIGTCGIGGKGMTEFKEQEKWKK